MVAITFLMGTDTGANQFYANARGFFTAQRSDVVAAPAGGQSLEGVFKVLRDRAAESPARIHDPINIVSHATGFSSLQFRLRAAATSPGIITADALTTEIVKINAKAADAWPQLGPPIITPTTRVVLYGCDVGRGASFLQDFGRLFGEDLHVYAPLRVAIFRHVGTVFEHRLARTWSVPWPSSIQATTNWTAARDKFVADATTKFGTRWQAVRNDPLGTIGLERELKLAADPATATQAASWFFEETVSLDVSDPQNPQADISRMIPLKSAILVPGGSDVDDTTVENVVGPAHVTDKVGPRTWAAHIAVLAQVIESPVDVTNGAHYRHIDIDPPKAASPGPTPPPNTPPVVPPAHSSLWDAARDALVAAGVGTTELDDLAASLAPAEASAQALADPGLASPTGSDRELAAEDFA